MNTYNNTGVNNFNVVGTLSEIKIKYTNERDGTQIKAKLIMQIDGCFVPFYIYCDKKNNKRFYYQILEELGIKYSEIKKYDSQSYSLEQEHFSPIISPYTRVYNKKVQIPTKLFLIGYISEYGLYVTYINKTNESQEYFNLNLQGYIVNKNIVLHNKDNIPYEIKFDYDKELNLNPKMLYELNLTYKNSTIIKDDIISNESFSKLLLTNIKDSGIMLSVGEYEKMIRELRMLNND